MNSQFQITSGSKSERVNGQHHFDKPQQMDQPPGNYLLKSFLKEDCPNLNMMVGLVSSPNRSEQSMLGLIPKDPFPKFNEITIPEEEMGLEDEEDQHASLIRLQSSRLKSYRYPGCQQTY
jgi:hypothetical protein